MEDLIFELENPDLFIYLPEQSQNDNYAYLINYANDYIENNNIVEKEKILKLIKDIKKLMSE